MLLTFTGDAGATDFAIRNSSFLGGTLAATRQDVNSLAASWFVQNTAFDNTAVSLLDGVNP